MMASPQLNPYAPEFVPSAHARCASLPGDKGYILLETHSLPYVDVPDEELFDYSLYPVTEKDLEELIATDEMNELLAELDLMEREEELRFLLHAKLDKASFQKFIETARRKRANQQHSHKKVHQKHHHHSDLLAAQMRVKSDMRKMSKNVMSPKTASRRHILQP